MVGPCNASRARTVADVHDDSGGIVVGWLTRLALVISVVGVLGFDGISIVATELSVTDQAGSTAAEAAQVWAQSHDVTKAYAAAVTTAAAADAGNSVPRKLFSVDAKGVVHLTVVRDAHTLVLEKWGRSRVWTHVTRTGEGHVPSA